MAAKEISAAVLFDKPPTVHFPLEVSKCKHCDGPLIVQKTCTQKISLISGTFHAHKTIGYCKNCGQIHHPVALRKQVPEGCNVGYDIIVFIGRRMYQNCRTANDIRNELHAKGIELSLSQVEYLGRKFIALLSLAHKQSIPAIRKVMQQGGGYILHLDGTVEGDSPVLMVGMDGISDIVLDSIKINSENSSEIASFLSGIQKAYGTPVALVHDMGAGILKAVKEVFPDVADFICHFHFLRDIGKDLLEETYKIIRNRLKKHGITTTLKKEIRSLKKLLSENEASLPPITNAINQGECFGENIDLSNLPGASAYALALWMLEGKKTGKGYGFPFDQTLVVFSERIEQAHKHLLEFKGKHVDGNSRNNRSLYTLDRIISKVANDKKLQNAIDQFHKRKEVFDKLRKALAMAEPQGNRALNDDGNATELKTIKTAVIKFRQQLDTKEKCYQKMALQIDKYTEKLFADPITVTLPSGEKITILPQRTNNIMERNFRDFKRNYKRKSGNNSMNRRLCTMPAETAFIKNLNNPDYMQALLSEFDNLQDLFASIKTSELRDKIKENTSPDRVLPGFQQLLKMEKLPEKMEQLFLKIA